MADPLAEVVSLLKPAPSISKLVSAAGRWSVCRAEMGRSFYCAIIEGGCRLTVPSRAPIILAEGDFILVPEVFDFTLSSLVPPTGTALPARIETSPGTFRLGDPDGPAELRALVGHCDFESRDKALLLQLLPEVIHVSGESRFIALVRMIHDETRADRVARDIVLRHLLEVLLIEALRTAPGPEAPPGLLRGLSDARLASALHRIHAEPARAWTVPELARAAGMSRSAFFERFRREVGTAPMEHLMIWRMALAKEMLLGKERSLAEIARLVGYGSPSAFSAAFARLVGVPPGSFAREDRET